MAEASHGGLGPAEANHYGGQQLGAMAEVENGGGSEAAGGSRRAWQKVE